MMYFNAAKRVHFLPIYKQCEISLAIASSSKGTTKMMFRRGYLSAYLRKWRKINKEVLACNAQEQGHWALLTCAEEEEAIPKDVPKGHMVVYVGEECKRYVISVAFLEHPLFQTLLDLARDVYEFNSDSKLCIPCEENIFIAILQYVRSQHAQRFWMCF